MEDFKGKIFSRLKVLYFDQIKNKKTYWKCLCECGNLTSCRADSLKIGRRKSCGCIKSPKEIEYLKKLQERLLKYSIEKNGCREWSVENRKLAFGYGFINVRKKYMGAHRAAWIAWKGKIPKGLFVLHKCDNPKCINPEHLFLGTQKDNIRDCIKKGRYDFNEKTQFKKGKNKHI